MATTRKRDLTFKSGPFTRSVTFWNVGRTAITSVSDTSSSISIVGRQETTDEGTSQWYRLPWFKRVLTERSSNTQATRHLYRYFRKRDLGTEFKTRTHRYIENAGSLEAKAPVVPLRRDRIFEKVSVKDLAFNGELFAKESSVVPTSTVWPVLADSDPLVLAALGASAISRVLPTNPVANAAVFAGEIRNDGLPLVPMLHSLKDISKYYKSLGDEYLNVQFGWKPFIADLRKFAFATNNLHKILRQYERDSGRGVRRKYSFQPLDETTVTQEARSFPKPTLSTDYYNYVAARDGELTRTRRKITNTWFSGCFTYYLNMGDSARDRMERHAQEANKLYGIRLTPDTLWNLAPWSWAADWVANTGDVIHNISAFSHDGLVMRYGYIMQHQIVADTYRLSDFYTASLKTIKPTPQTFVTETKCRQKATPYGFGLNWSSFTPGQIAIIAALGLSRTA